MHMGNSPENCSCRRELGQGMWQGTMFPGVSSTSPFPSEGAGLSVGFPTNRSGAEGLNATVVLWLRQPIASAPAGSQARGSLPAGPEPSPGTSAPAEGNSSCRGGSGHKGGTVLVGLWPLTEETSLGTLTLILPWYAGTELPESPALLSAVSCYSISETPPFKRAPGNSPIQAP